MVSWRFGHDLVTEQPQYTPFPPKHTYSYSFLYYLCLILLWCMDHIGGGGIVPQSRLTLCYPVDCSPPSSCPWNSPGKNTRVGCHSLLQGIFLTQGSNSGLIALQADSLSSEPPGKLFYRYTTVFLFVHRLMDIWVVLTFWLKALKINSAGVKIHTTFVWISIFSSFGYISRSGIAWTW